MPGPAAKPGRKAYMMDNYKKAQEAYDRREHPDYWDDPDDEALDREIDRADMRRDELKESPGKGNHNVR